MKNERVKEKKFSLIDLFIALLLICAVCGMLLRALNFDMGYFSGTEETYYITYEITGADSEISLMLGDGAVFYTESEKQFGKNFGKVNTTPAKILSLNSEGEYVQSYSDGSTVDIKGTIEVNGVMTDRGLLTCGSYYQANMKLVLLCSGAEVEVQLLDIVKSA